MNISENEIKSIRRRLRQVLRIWSFGNEQVYLGRK
jgi:hypothetical protein